MLKETSEKVIELIKQEKYDEALSVLNTKSDCQDDDECLYYLGIAYQQQGYLENAEKYYLQALIINEDNLEASFNLAALYHNKGYYSKAIEYFTSIYKINSKFEDVTHRMGCCEYNNRQYKECIESMTEYVNQGNTRKLESAYFIRGYCYHELIEDEKALEDYESSLKINDKSNGAILGKAVSLCVLGKIEEAITLLNNSLNNDKDDLLFLLNLGNCYEKQGQYKQSLEYYNKCIKLDDKFTPAILNKGIVCMKNGDIKNAEHLLLTANEIDDKDNNTKIALGNLYMIKGDYGKSTKYLQDAIQINRSHIALTNYGVLISKQERYVEAIQYYKEALSIYEKSGLICLNIGFAYYKIGLFRESEGYYQKALYLNHDERPVYHGLIMLSRDKGEYKKARCYAKLIHKTDLDNYKHKDSLLYDEILIDYYEAIPSEDKDKAISVINRIDTIISGNKTEKEEYANQFLLIKSQLYSKLNNYIRGYALAEEYYRKCYESLENEKRKNLKIYIKEIWQRKTDTPLLWWLYPAISDNKMISLAKIILFNILVFISTFLITTNTCEFIQQKFCVSRGMEFSMDFYYVSFVLLIIICLPFIRRIKVGKIDIELVPNNNGNLFNTFDVILENNHKE